MRSNLPEWTVLVVDDDEVFRTRLIRSLTQRGIRAYGAQGGSEALVLAQSQKPNAAIIDLRMPDMFGLEVVRQLRALYEDTAILVLTGYGSIATAVEAMRIGATSYLTKPVDADQILQAFSKASESPSPPSPSNTPSLARVEWEHIHRVLQDCGGNISEAARQLGIHRRSLQRKLAKYPTAR